MKTILIVTGVGLAGYGLYLLYQKQKKNIAKNKSFVAAAIAEKESPAIVPDSVKENFDVDNHTIFAGGTYRNTSWPAPIV